MARSALLNNQNFRYLWAGDAIGQFGAQLAGFVIPVFAVQYLHASEMEMGVLNAAEQAAFLVIGLPVGAWVDRMRKRRVMIVTDMVRALVLAVLVALTFTGHASIPVLIAVALAISVCNTFFDVAYQSFVPAVTGKRHLLEGNSKLEATHSVMYIVGPALGGLLIRFVNPKNSNQGKSAAHSPRKSKRDSRGC
jgi:MFS family permease